ncbi:MAG: hypothetical protein JOZ19_08170 [Rubrobacter sp.]|nr:hypothetical protein [Rubrobacter sp.]
MRVIDRVAGHYEAQDVEFGRIYRWCRESVLVECKCGERLTFKSSELIGSEATTCECGADHTAGVREELVLKVLDEDGEAARHP